MHFESQKLSFGSTTTKTTSLRSQKKDANSKHHTEQNNSLAHTMSATTIAAKPTTFPLRRRKHVAFFAWRRRHDYFPTTLRGPAPPLFSPSRRHINSGGALNASSALTGREPSETLDVTTPRLYHPPAVLLSCCPCCRSCNRRSGTLAGDGRPSSHSDTKGPSFGRGLFHHNFFSDSDFGCVLCAPTHYAPSTSTKKSSLVKFLLSTQIQNSPPLVSGDLKLRRLCPLPAKATAHLV